MAPAGSRISTRDLCTEEHSHWNKQDNVQDPQAPGPEGNQTADRASGEFHIHTHTHTQTLETLLNLIHLIHF